MTLEISHPASIFDMAELIGATTRLQWAAAREMHANGRTWAVRDPQGRLILLAGLYPVDGDPPAAEAWFNIAPGAGVHLLGILRVVKLTIGASQYGDIVTVCRSEAGKRIARAVGFSFYAHSTLGEVWTWKDCSATPEKPHANSRKPSSANRSPTSPASRPRSTRPAQPAAVRNEAAARS
jgi:hypothetical protein